MSKPKLTNDDFCRAAKKLRCEVAAIKAVDDTESRGEAFYSNGFPTILFERHKFRKYTGGAFNGSHPHISGPAGGYGKPGQNQQNKFNEAFQLDPLAAMKSCSWGRYQIMGFNYALCGFASVGAFVDAMKESEGRQLDAFVGFVIHEHLADELRGHDWAGFAQGYNGENYKINKYDTKMATAYKRFAKENIDCSLISAAALPIAPEPTSTGAHETDEIHEEKPLAEPTSEPPPINQEPTVIKQEAEQIINTGDTAQTAPPPEDKTLNAPAKDGATATSVKTTIAGITIPAFLVAIGQGISDLVQKGYIDAREIGTTLLQLLRDNYKYVFYLIALIILVLIVKKIVKQVTFWLSMISLMVPSFNNVKVNPAGTPEVKDVAKT